MSDKPVHDEKYIVFKRDEFAQWWSQPSVGGMSHPVEIPSSVDDAVVIRRQDSFAAPALATYASMIAMVAHNIDDLETAKELLAIADYFEDQASLAADEGFKLPDR